MIGTLVNVAAVLLGGALGCLLRRGLPQKVSATVTPGLGLCVIIIGVQGALKTQSILLVILSVVLGGILGSLVGVEKGLNRLGERVQARFAGAGGNFGRAFVTSSLLFCVGAMSIVGSLDAGLSGNNETLYAKAVIDGVSAVIFASAMGPGVLLSAAVVLVYQGGIALLAQVVAPILTQTAIAEMSAVGGVLLVGIGLNLIRKEHIPVGDMLPAVFLPLLLTLFM